MDLSIIRRYMLLGHTGRDQIDMVVLKFSSRNRPAPSLIVQRLHSHVLIIRPDMLPTNLHMRKISAARNLLRQTPLTEALSALSLKARIETQALGYDYTTAGIVAAAQVQVSDKLFAGDPVTVFIAVNNVIIGKLETQNKLVDVVPYRTRKRLPTPQPSPRFIRV
jgi:hypothetical protein